VNPPAQPGTLQRRPRSATIGTGRFTNADPAQDEQIDQGLESAPATLCPHCGRSTKTTSDGICAACWGSKGGRPMGWKKEAPRGSFLEDLRDLFLGGPFPW